MRLIDADVLLKEWRLECGGACFIRKDKYCMRYDRTKGVCTLIIKAPTVEPRKHGRWIKITQEWVDDAEYLCSCCGRKIKAPSALNPVWAFPYCHCGARIDEVEE